MILMIIIDEEEARLFRQKRLRSAT